MDDIPEAPSRPAARPERRATMAQIAVLAGTSVPTVSKVLNGGTDVSEATRSRVTEVAERLGYTLRPRTAPGAGEGTVTWTDRRTPPVVDVVVQHVGGSWISGVLEGVEAEAAAFGADLALSVARPGAEWIGRLLRRPTLGVILVLAEPTAGELATLGGAGIPVVVVDPISRPPGEVASIGATNWDGGRLAAEHLLDLGHRSFGVIGGRRGQLAGSARIDGFRTALRDAGVALEPERIHHCDWNRERAGAATAAMLAGPGERPTAIFACSDIMALGVYDAAHEVGVAVPAELSVVGFDDVQESAWASPPLTTVQQPIVEMGAAAFRLLQRSRRLEYPVPGVPAARMELETRLIRRSTTATAAAAS